MSYIAERQKTTLTKVYFSRVLDAVALVKLHCRVQRLLPRGGTLARLCGEVTPPVYAAQLTRVDVGGRSLAGPG